MPYNVTVYTDPYPVPHETTNTVYHQQLSLQPSILTTYCNYWYKFVLSEGRNNQIRKMVEAFGLRVQRLIRIKQGEYELDKELFENKYKIIDN